MSYFLKNIAIEGLWDCYKIVWDGIHEDVNILVGINGSGKSTLLNILEAYYTGNKKLLKNSFGNLVISGMPKPEECYPMKCIRTFDIPSPDKRSAASPLMQELNDAVYDLQKGPSFFGYRMKILDYPEREKEIQEHINVFFETVNTLFADTSKQIRVERNQMFFEQKGKRIELEDLSSGEKQMLLGLITALLMEKKPAILLMDEPEISLHLSWQRQLVDVLRRMNPNCQLIITTHSPSIFSKGWGDKAVYMEELLKPVKE
ncbi:AAA family ATPase [Phocaeicola sartorii]|uniref:AAA family ATPase n=1 Tax=Phocaeicola sartorii TaxID=671267 RepID=UPI00242E0C89|nr:ATP-binding protein [Phocaeicola sartorii]